MPRVETEEQAVQVLLRHQREAGGTTSQPAADATEETATGWAFFNVRGYLGTVTPDGQVILEPEHDADAPA